MEKTSTPPLRIGRYNKGGINSTPASPPPGFQPAPMGIPFQTPGPENGRRTDRETPPKP